ncbi:MAG: GGDEF domain-containing protein [Elusimicrobiota bacterium]
MTEKKDIKEKIEDINKQLMELKREIDLLRKERYTIVEEQKNRFQRIIDIEIQKVTSSVDDSLREISEQTSNQIYKLHNEGKKVGKKIDKVAEEKAEEKAAKTLYSMEKQAARKLKKDVENQIEKETGKMKDAVKEAEKKAITDDLTQAYNRRYFMPRLQTEFGIARRAGDNLSLVILDIDDFKKINDTYGHPAGDNVLAEISGAIKKHLRKSDLLIRYGGEEFVILLPRTTKDKAVKTAERIRNVVEDIPFYWEGDSFNITVSLGVATFPEDADKSKDLLNIADKRLLEAKETGKNKTISS